MTTESGGQRHPVWSRHGPALILLALTLGLLAGLPWVGNPLHRTPFYGRALDLPVPPFALRDTAGQMHRERDLSGHFTFLMFGYIGCERLCHVQVAVFQALSRRVPAGTARFVYVAMDPRRDTAAQVQAYFDARGADFQGLMPADLAEAQAVAGRFKAFFSLTGDPRQGDYRIDHPGHIFLIDPRGLIRLVYGGDALDVAAILHDLDLLTQEEPS